MNSPNWTVRPANQPRAAAYALRAEWLSGNVEPTADDLPFALMAVKSGAADRGSGTQFRVLTVYLVFVTPIKINTLEDAERL